MKGKLVLYRKKDPQTAEEKPYRTEDEVKRFRRALSRVKKEQQDLYEKAKETADPSAAEIFGAQLLVLSDEEFLSLCEEKLEKQKLSAQEAVEESFAFLLSHFRMEQDQFFRERLEDLNDVKTELVLALREEENRPESERYEGILMARKLSPRELLMMDKSRITGLVLGEGSALSHTVILARGMGIPLVILPEKAEDPWENWEGREAVLLPEKNLLLFHAEEAAPGEKREVSVSFPAQSSCIPVYANVSDERELPFVLEAKPSGIGLFRSEYLYLRHPDYHPSEEEQITVYRKLLRSFFPKPVVIRTADLALDKLPEITLSKDSLFKMKKSQLRALLSASSAGNLKILLPRISDVSEVRRAKDLIMECRRELEWEGTKVKDVPAGIMIETPSAALCAADLAREADFFSIGTNDLTALALGQSRETEGAKGLHPSVLSLIRMTVDAARRERIPVTLCGEAAGDLSLTQTFLDIGVDAFSVNYTAISPLRKIMGAENPP